MFIDAALEHAQQMPKTFVPYKDVEDLTRPIKKRILTFNIKPGKENGWKLKPTKSSTPAVGSYQDDKSSKYLSSKVKTNRWVQNEISRYYA